MRPLLFKIRKELFFLFRNGQIAWGIIPKSQFFSEFAVVFVTY